MSRHDAAMVAELEARYCDKGAPGAGGLVWPGAARWHALRVQPQREDQAEAWLGLRGVYGFHPVLVRRVVRFGAVREYPRRYLPGYVFARFPGAPVAHAVLDCPFVVDVIRRATGEWGTLDPADLRALHAMRRIDADARRAAASRRRRAQSLAPGDTALFRSGIFAGRECEVVTLRGAGGVLVRLNLFGGDVPVEVPAADLVALRKGG